MDVEAGELVGRERELALIGELLEGARRGSGGVLTLSGEPGAGKTALLAEARRLASDFTVVACCGVEWEAEIPFSALHELVRPLAGLHDALPTPQRRELEAALGMRDDVPVNGFHVHAAALSLILEATRERPVLVIADDLQWIDAVSAQTLAFVGRRLSSDAVAMVVGTRPGGRLPGVPEPVDVAPLDRIAVGELAARELGRSLPGAALDELTRASAGNPLAVIESAAHAGDELWFRGSALDGPLPVGELIERGFSDRLGGLSAEALRAAIVVAESLAADDAMILRAVELCGLRAAALTELLDSGVLRNDHGVWRFSHPLLRSIVHQRGAGPERRAAHAALAEAATDADRRAWHAAEAAGGTDESVGDALAEAAVRYASLSGMSAAARALERAATLTRVPDLAASRLLEAARALYSAGAPHDRIRALLERALDVVESARVQLAIEVELLSLRVYADDSADVRASMVPYFERALEVDHEIAAELARSYANESSLMGDAEGLAKAVELLDATLKLGTLPAPLADMVEVDRFVAALALGKVPPSGGPLVAFARRQTAIIDALGALRPVGFLTVLADAMLWIEEFEEAAALVELCVAAARDRGSVGDELGGTAVGSAINFRTGDWTTAAAAADRARALAELTPFAGNGALADAVAQLIRGVRTGSLDDAALAEAETFAHASGMAAIREFAGAARGLTALTAGSAKQAAAHLEEVRAWKRRGGQVEVSIGTWPVDLVQAHVLAGDLEAARDALGDVRAAAEVRGRRWALAAVPWLEALLEDDDTAAFALFELALERYPVARAPFEEARARLAYGQRLRRANRRADARGQLEAALAGFARLGAEPWAERARRELGASGKGVRRAEVHERDGLTLQERQVAALVAAGASNKEAAGELFLSPKTIETHLSRIYRKLGVTSRTQLALRWDERSAM